MASGQTRTSVSVQRSPVDVSMGVIIGPPPLRGTQDVKYPAQLLCKAIQSAGGRDTRSVCLAPVAVPRRRQTPVPFTTGREVVIQLVEHGGRGAVAADVLLSSGTLAPRRPE